jgi:imidazolonepropionase-like amidohydrolase
MYARDKSTSPALSLFWIEVPNPNGHNASSIGLRHDARREIPDGEMLIRDGFIEPIGGRNTLPQEADEIVDLSDHIVLPDFINTPSSPLSVARSRLRSLEQVRQVHAATLGCRAAL